MVKPCLIVHGGAWDIPEAEHDAHLVGVGRAAGIGYASLVSMAEARSMLWRRPCAAWSRTPPSMQARGHS